MGLLWVEEENSRGWFDETLGINPEFTRSPGRFCVQNRADQILDCEGRQIYRSHFPVGKQNLSCFVYIFRNLSFNRALRPSYAFHCMEMSQKLSQSGFCTFRCLAAFRPRAEMLNWNSVLVATEIDSVFELPSSGSHLYPVHPTIPLSSTLTMQLALELSRFHQKGFFHGDLKTRHILVRPPASLNGHQSFQFFFVDLEKARHMPSLPSFGRDILAVRDLIQLFESLPGEDRLNIHSDPAGTFLDGYFEGRGFPDSRRRRFRKMLSFYGPHGQLRQGETLIGALFSLLSPRRKTAGGADPSDD